MKTKKINEQKLKEIRDFYNTDYYENIKLPGRPSAHLRRLANKLQMDEGKQVLDVGCGIGEWLMACTEKGAKVSGIDLSQKAINVCLSAIPNGEFHSGSAEALPFENSRFDIVSCLGSLEHFIEPKLALDEMIRVAKPGASFLLLVPNLSFLTRRLGLYKGTNQTAAKEDVRDLKEWEHLFSQAGLRVIGRWKDLHVFSWRWMSSQGVGRIPVRFFQALLLVFWPLEWQYQVYFMCVENGKV